MPVNKLKKRSRVAGTMSHRIMERIHAENIEIKGESQFVLRNLLLGLSLAVVFLLGIFFVSLTFDRLAIPRVFGTRFVFAHFPWFSAGLAVSCFFLSFALIERYKLLYRWSLLRLTGVLMVIFLVLGFVIYKLPIHDRLRLSKFQGLYAVEGAPLEIFTGHVTEARTDTSFTFVTIYGTSFRVYLASGVLAPSTTITEDQSLVIAGNREGNTVVARAILNLGERRRKQTK